MKQSNSQNKTKKTPTSVTLIDQSQQFKQNSILIGKMFGQNLANSIPLAKSNNLFAGGFKYRSDKQQEIIQKQAQLKNKSKFVQNALQNSSNKFTVYDQFGIISDTIGKNKSKPKYRDQISVNTTSYNNFSKVEDNVNQMRKNRQQKFQDVLSKEYVNLHQYYDIAKQKDRQQVVSHVKSSLNAVTLQNIQAKLQAHRRQLKPIEEEYNMKMGKSSIAKQKQNQPKQTLKFSDNFYNQNSGENEVYQLIKKVQKQDPNQIQFDNMWAQKLRKNPKLAEYDKKYQQFLLQKDAKKMLGGVVRQNLFNWQKSTHIQSKKSKHQIKKSISKQKIYSKSPIKEDQNQLSDQNLKSKDVAQILASKDDKFIAKYIFAQIDIQKRGLLSKEQLLEFITQNQHIIKGYNFDMKWIFTDLDNFSTKRKGMLTKDELALFLATFQKAQHPQIVLKSVKDEKNKLLQEQKVDNSKKSRIVVNFSKHRKTFQNLFQSLDITDDKLLKREQFIESIYLDAVCNKLIDGIAVDINAIQKKITYRQILSLILDDYRKQKNQKLRKSKQYITFERFCEYFQFPQTIDLRQVQDKKRKKNQQTLTKQHQLFDIQSEQIQILKDLFSTIPRIYQDFIASADFIQTALLDPLVLSFQDQLCRIQSVQTGLPIQTVKQTLQRMIRQCQQYADWQTIKGFLSRRGRPLDWNEQLITKKKELRQQKRQQSINQALKKQIMDQTNVQNKSKSKLNMTRKRQVDRYTVPQPFHITDEQKKVKQDQINKGKEEFTKLNTFKAKPVNKEILQPKPQLIAGKRKQSSQKSRITYNYQNYQNDRIQRALKKAQQKYQEEQQILKIKEQAQIKAATIGIDLTKKYKDIIKQQQNKKEKEKEKQTKNIIQVIVNQRLYPKDIKKEAERKRQKLNEKQQKLKQAQKRKKDQEIQKRKGLQQKNKQARQKVAEIKKQKQKDQQEREKLKVGDLQFKPKINKKELSQKDKQELEKGKVERERKKKQQQQKKMEIMQAMRMKRLQHQKKDPFTSITQFENSQDIIDHIYDIKLQELLLQDDVKQYKKSHDLDGKGKKQANAYWNGIAARFKLTMQKQEKAIKFAKKQQSQKAQTSNLKKNQKQTQNKNQKANTKKLNSDITFNKSKALRRYRQIMDGKSPSQVPSQFDKDSKIGLNFQQEREKQISNIQENSQDQSQN